MRHEAIYATHPNVVRIDDSSGAFDINEKLIQLDESLVQEKIIELQAAEPLRQLREQRNQKLSQSDWMAVADRTMSPEQIAYRQALRDMPANNPDVALNEAGELINVTWPTEPQ
jgi:hypothetical protein